MVGAANAGAASADASTGGNAGALVGLVQSFGVGIVRTIAGGLSDLAGIAVVILLAVLLTYYFMRDGGAYVARIPRADGPGTTIARRGGRSPRIQRPRRVHGRDRRHLDLRGGDAVADHDDPGLPYALPLAVLAVFGGFIPYIGSLITTGLAFLVTVATGSPTDIAIMAVFTIVFNIVQGNFVAPIVYSKVVSLHPAVVLVAIPAGNEIAGVIGMFLVVPFLGVFAAVWRTVLRVLDPEPVEPLETGRADRRDAIPRSRPCRRTRAADARLDAGSDAATAARR